MTQPALKKVERLGVQLGSDPDRGDVRTFQKAQREFWVEQREIGNPWLITDFITMGSPLTHGLLLFAKDEADLNAQKKDGELPTCPPAEYSPKEIYSYKDEIYEIDGQRRRVRLLSHDAPFAGIRWTNMYFPVKWWFGGDLVGGPLAATFGKGVLDIPLTRTKWQYWPLFPHIGYWRMRRFWKADESIRALKSALGLNSSSWLPAKAPR